MKLSNRSEVRRNFARACAKGGVRVSDELIDEWVDQVWELRDFYEKEVYRLQADFNAEIGVLKQELAALRKQRPLPANVIRLQER